jgi:hypothetical protein
VKAASRRQLRLRDEQAAFRGRYGERKFIEIYRLPQPKIAETLPLTPPKAIQSEGPSPGRFSALWAEILGKSACREVNVINPLI